MKTSNLYSTILDSKNIYNAIYSLESYVFEKGLLSEEDLDLFNKLSDKYNYTLIENVIEECQLLLGKILDNPDELFEISVFFKLKKYKEDDESVAYRPIHTAGLITQICIVCLLNQIMYDDSFGGNSKKKNKKYSRKLSEISNLIPSNFYGNIPSLKPESLFISWKHKYKEYTEIIIDKYYEYKDNKSYKNEVCLDIENFYPTVNPIIIYNLILNKMLPSLNNDGSEIECLKTIIYKLLYFKMKDFKKQWYNIYYDLATPKQMPKTLYNKGIPQGLPQAYFFSNLCMTEIAKSANKIFEGDAYYYVDDSVIYTNNEEDEFEDNLNELNEDIQKSLRKYNTKLNIATIIPRNIIDAQKNFYYNIRIHDNKTKSTITPLSDAYYGLANLRAMAGIASNVGFNIYNTIDEDEDTTLLEKIETILKGIDKEIDRVKEKDLDAGEDNQKPTQYYKKFLRKYKRFFLFRRKVLELKTEQDYDNIINNFFSKYINIKRLSNKSINTEEKKEFFERFDEDIFAAEIRLILDSLKPNEYSDKFDDFVKKINKLETLIVENRKLIAASNQLYFQKDIEGAKKIIFFIDKKYESLNSCIKQNLQSFEKSTNEIRINRLMGFLKEEAYQKTIKINPCSDFIYNISNEFKRKIFNVLFSHITNIDISDDYIFLKSDYRALMYYELRLIAYLRNKHFNTKEFIFFANEVLANVNDELSVEKVDYHIFEVLHIFYQRVKSPKHIDSLILIHKLVNGLWKNGSRFLHFYTLHNEEHSLELIKNSIKISNSIDYFNLKDMDYYVLFLSCYLHDISMVIHPNLDNFYKDIFETDVIYTNWLCEVSENLDISVKKDAKKHILDYFKKVYGYFETNVRINHHKLSTKFIIDKSKTKYLNFIEKSILQIVANVSEAHCYDTNEVYGRKSFAQRDMFSIKYLMIILRMADLFDMSKDRVSYYILKENIRHMEPISQFHWISHYITEKCEIKSKYEIKSAGPEESYLRKGSMKETIEIDIFLNIKQLTSVTPSNCPKISSSIDIEEDKISIKIKDKEDDKCSAPSCPFLCKWMTKKHGYLFSELFELNKYLDRANRGLFTTEFKINLYYNDAKRLEPEFMDMVNHYID